jgi:probable F420-dependent oxidoreductase
MSIALGTIGVWQFTPNATPDLAAAAEKQGYGTFWIGGSPAGSLEQAEALLDATERITVATGIVNMWQDDAATVAASYHRLEGKHPGRFALGVGVGHREAISEYRKPYDKIVEYLDQLADAGVPADRLILAALGPKVLELAAARCGGAHPYLTTSEHTAFARKVLGPDTLLAPEHKVVLETDVAAARTLGRKMLKRYLALVNYRQNLLRFGFSEDDMADGGSDRLVDALVLHGDTETVARGLREHLEAGADHLCIQVLGDDLPAGDQELAEALE